VPQLWGKNRPERYSEAEPLYNRALKIHAKDTGEEHPDMALALANYSILSRILRRDSEAEELQTGPE
jgi:hypothetical protein